MCTFRAEVLSRGVRDASDESKPGVKSKQTERGLVKMLSLPRDIETQDLERLVAPDTKYLKTNTRLKDEEQILHRMRQDLIGLLKANDIALGRSCNVVVHGTPELFMKKRNQKKGAFQVPSGKVASNGGNVGAFSYQRSTLLEKMAGSQ